MLCQRARAGTGPVSGFSGEWLALREPVDDRSRSGTLVTRLSARAPEGQMHILDLGAGTGANLRYLAPRLGGEQEWLLVDHDSSLLGLVEERLSTWAGDAGLKFRRVGDTLALEGPDLSCLVRRQQLDLAQPSGRLKFPDPWLVTASALMDLVAQSWLEALLARCRSAGTQLLFALNYDGTAEFSPKLAHDSRVHALVNQHQALDKGFGPALGPRAAQHAPALFRRWGYDVEATDSPWRLGPEDSPLQTALLDGWAQAAVAMAPNETELVRDWLRRRSDRIATGASNIRIGHRDLLACPAARSEA